MRALADPAKAVLAMPEVLIHAGPGWFARVAEAATPTGPASTARDIGWRPWRWPAWWWALLVGAGMICAGLVATLIALGPVLLWYDQAFLGIGRDQLPAVNPRLVGFLQHDRITMAGTLVAIGVLYTGLAVGGIRRGWPWARDAYLVSGLVGFPTLFYFLGFRFVEPLHAAATTVLFPMFLAATGRHLRRPYWTVLPEGPEFLRRKALRGQLLLVLTGIGLFIGGVAVSTVGLTDVFVESDLAYLHTTPDALPAANPRLLPFIAHDRAGFGGALMSAAVAITLLVMWGWRRGESWVWWSLALAAAAGFLPPVAVHAAIGYTDAGHLAPVVAGIALTVTALILARPYLCARPPAARIPREGSACMTPGSDSSTARSKPSAATASPASPPAPSPAPPVSTRP